MEVISEWIDKTFFDVLNQNIYFAHKTSVLIRLMILIPSCDALVAR